MAITKDRSRIGVENAGKRLYRARQLIEGNMPLGPSTVGMDKTTLLRQLKDATGPTLAQMMQANLIGMNDIRTILSQREGRL